MNFLRIHLGVQKTLVFTVVILALFRNTESALNEIDENDMMEMKPPLESAINYYDKFYTSFNRFTRDVPLVHFGRNYGPDLADDDSQEVELREKRQVKFEDSDSKPSSPSSKQTAASGVKHFEENVNSATLSLGPASLSVSAGDAKHFGGGYPGGLGGGYYPGGGAGYYPGGGLGGGYYPGGGAGYYPGGGYYGGGGQYGGSSASASAVAGPGGSFSNANGGAYHQGGYPGGGYYPGGQGGYYPGGFGGGGYPGAGYYPGGFGGGYRPGFGGGLYDGFGPGYGYGRKGNDDKADPALKSADKPSSPAKSASSSSSVKFSSN